jgi:lantibiotic transport system permease protein
MSAVFVHAFQGEWLKKKRSLAWWLVIVGGFFTPAVVIVARLVRHASLPEIYASDAFWTQLWTNSWESMALFFLPMGAILATSLIAQIEYRNNAWKQVHALPLNLATIYFSKFAVVLVMMVQFFILFNLGVYLSAVVPYLLIGGVGYPKAPLPYAFFLRENLLYFVDCLPIVALQYLLSLRFKNFLVAIGFGFMTWVAALASLSWKYGFVIPYTYGMLNYLKDNPGGKAVIPDVDIHSLAIGYFVLFTVLGFLLFVTKAEKG